MSDPELTPDQEADVRRLLSEARHGDPVPDDVAARLDRVLVGLTESEGQVVDLAARRRRRRVRALLLAASVVVVGGFAGGQLAKDDGPTAGATAEAPSSTRQRVEAADRSDGGAVPEAAPSDDTRSASGLKAPLPDKLVAKVPSVSTRHFGRDVARYRSLPRAEKDARPLSGSDFVCEAADWGAGRLVPVLADGRPAVLVYRPPRGDSQVVDLLQCGSGDVLRSTTVPLR